MELLSKELEGYYTTQLALLKQRGIILNQLEKKILYAYVCQKGTNLSLIQYGDLKILKDHLQVHLDYLQREKSESKALKAFKHYLPGVEEEIKHKERKGIHLRNQKKNKASSSPSKQLGCIANSYKQKEVLWGKQTLQSLSSSRLSKFISIFRKEEKETNKPNPVPETKSDSAHKTNPNQIHLSLQEYEQPMQQESEALLQPLSSPSSQLISARQEPKEKKLRMRE